MENHTVYQITNTKNGKSYIGYTSSTLEKRWKEHKKRARLGSDYHFHVAIRKHGADSFSPKVLFVEETLKGAKETEILMILDRCPEYNKTMGGDGTPGHPMTDELREKIRANTPVRKGINHPLFGGKRPDVAERNTNTVYTQERREKCKTRGMLGKKNPNAIAAMRAARPRVISEETRAKMSAAAKKRLLTPEGQTNASNAGKKGAAARWHKDF